MRVSILAIALVLTSVPASAGTIRDACLKGERRGSPQLCSCIQAAADRTLTQKDQRLAATFFSDPDRAQEIRQSKSRSHSVFWERYKSFGQTAEAYCS